MYLPLLFSTLKTQIIKPINSVDFRSKIRTAKSFTPVDYLQFFKTHIEQAGSYAIGPYFWFIPDNSGPRTVAASPSFEQLTPYSVEELIQKSETPYFFAQNIFEADRMYVLSAIEMAMKISEKYYAAKWELPKANIYCRMINKNHEFVWRLIQFPAIYFNEAGQAEGVFVMITDLSHLPHISKPMMTIIDNHHSKDQFFKVPVETMLLTSNDLPKLTKREKELIHLVLKGFKNPLIALEMGISINTVQNHKRNLREKTNTHTSGELVAYLMEHHLI